MKHLFTATALALSIPAFAGAAMQETPVVEQQAKLTDAEAAEAEQIFADLAAAHRSDPMAISDTFGLRIADRSWTVKVDRKETPSKRGRLTDHQLGPHDVVISEGEPDVPTYVFQIANMEVLRLIASGKVNAGTTAMQSFGSDQVGVEIRETEGFKDNAGAEGRMYQNLSHFFTKGTPEITYFGEENALETHGAQATALHMMKGTRVLFFSMQPEKVVNEDPRLQKGQMPNLFVITKGRGVGYLGDRKIDLKPGMSIFVAPFVRHEIKAVGDEPMEGVVVLYGDNSDFAFGTSYPAFLEDLYDFYGSYQFKKD